MKTQRINTPNQDKAIKAIMAKRRAAWRSDGRNASQFPSFSPGWTTTEDYVKRFDDALHHVPVQHTGLRDGPAPYYTGPEVTAEVILDDDDDDDML